MLGFYAQCLMGLSVVFWLAERLGNCMLLIVYMGYCEDVDIEGKMQQGNDTKNINSSIMNVDGSMVGVVLLSG